MKNSLQLEHILYSNCNVFTKKKEEKPLEFKHSPVMLEECLEGLKIKCEGTYIDGTLRRSRTQHRNSKKTKRKRTTNRNRPRRRSTKGSKTKTCKLPKYKVYPRQSRQHSTNTRNTRYRRRRWNIIRFGSFVVSARQRRKRLQLYEK